MASYGVAATVLGDGNADSLCPVINLLEGLLQRPGSYRNSSLIHDYHFALSRWRAAGIVDPPECRLKALADGLCTIASQTGADWFGRTVATPTWSSHFRSLQLHLQHHCHRFHDYHPLGWRPRIFAMGNYTLPIKRVRRLFASASWPYWSQAALQTNYFGSQIERMEVDGVLLRHDRFEKVHNLFVLAAATGVLPNDLSQVVEFVAGTGDNVAIFRELGFRGSYFIFDVPPMLLFQQYVLRYSGWDAHIADDVDHLQGSTTLESDPEKLMGNFKQGMAKQSLFLATFSLTETPLHERRWVGPWLRNFGVVLLAYRLRWDHVDNLKYIIELTDEGLAEHSVCTWVMADRLELDPFWKKSFYLVAMRRDLAQGSVRCPSEAGCGLNDPNNTAPYLSPHDRTIHWMGGFHRP